MKLLEFLKKHLYIPSFKNRTEVVYEIGRILVSLIAGVVGFAASSVIYFENNPILQVNYIGEVLISILAFSVFYYFIPHLIRAVGDALTKLLYNSIKDTLESLPNFSPSNKKPQLKTYKTRPILLDTSSLIDGRICGVIKEGFIDSQVIVPQFVLDELHLISDSSTKLKREKGRRGLLILEDIKKVKKKDFEVYPTDKVEDVDKALVTLAKKISARIATTDYNLNKVAKIKGITVLNINNLANSLKTSLIPGDVIDIQVIKKGESSGQGVGYLKDGTMVVVSKAADYVNKELQVEVTKVLQTEAGQMIFADITTSFLEKISANKSSKKSKKKSRSKKS